MKTIIQKIYKLALFPEYVFVTLKQFLKHLPANTKTIVFTLEDKRLYHSSYDGGRYAFGILQMFNDGGYNVYLHKKVGFLTYVRLGVYGRLIYSLNNVKIVPDLPKNSEHIVYAFDVIDRDVLSHPWKHLIYVNIEKSPFCNLGECISMPYSLHPLVHKFTTFKKIDELRQRRRHLRMFFIGSTQYYYMNNIKIARYGLSTRAEDLKALSEVNERIKVLKTLFDLKAILHSGDYFNEVVIFKTDGNKNRIKWHEWLNFLSCSDFFLCFVGSDYPMCHNAIESMAVGTIPIISYPDWFTPPLQHRKNAIIYSDKDDLARKIHEVFAMNPDEIAAMRQNVIQYYDENLNPAAFIKRFESQVKRINTLILLPRLILTDSEQTESNQIMDSLKIHFGNNNE